MLIHTERFVIRDFDERDRVAFVAYQRDERYRRLYDLPDDGGQRADELFDRFAVWKQELPRRNVQVGISTASRAGCVGAAAFARAMCRMVALSLVSSSHRTVGGGIGWRSTSPPRWSTMGSRYWLWTGSRAIPRAATVGLSASRAGSVRRSWPGAPARTGWPLEAGWRSAGPCRARRGSACEENPARPMRPTIRRIQPELRTQCLIERSWKARNSATLKGLGV